MPARGERSFYAKSPLKISDSDLLSRVKFPCFLILLSVSCCWADDGKKDDQSLANQKATAADVAVPLGTPSPTPNSTATPAPTPRVYYALRAISVTTEVGILGITPGARLQLIEARDDGLYVTNGKEKFLVNSDAVTTSHREANAAYEAFVEAQKLLHEKMRKVREDAAKAEQERRAKMRGMTE